MKRSTMARRHLMFVDDPDAGSGGSGGDNGGSSYTPPATQADLDRIIGERVARVKTTPPADYADLQAAAARLAEIEAANATDRERAVAAAKDEGRTEALTAANDRVRTAEARALAAEGKFRNPVLAVKAIDLSQVKVNDDGTVDADAIRDQLKALAEAEPYLVDDGKARPKPDGSQGQVDRGKPSGAAAGRDLFEAKRKPAPTP